MSTGDGRRRGWLAWKIGEVSGATYGTPRQVSQYVKLEADRLFGVEPPAPCKTFKIRRAARRRKTKRKKRTRRGKTN